MPGWPGGEEAPAPGGGGRTPPGAAPGGGERDVDGEARRGWKTSQGGSPPPAGTTGLYHTAILYPTRRALVDALRRVLQAGIPLAGASDHGVSEALYLRDPDDNGVELYWD